MSKKSVAKQFLEKRRYNITAAEDTSSVMNEVDVEIYGEIVKWETWLILKPNHTIAVRELSRIKKENQL